MNGDRESGMEKPDAGTQGREDAENCGEVCPMCVGVTGPDADDCPACGGTGLPESMRSRRVPEARNATEAETREALESCEAAAGIRARARGIGHRGWM